MEGHNWVSRGVEKTEWHRQLTDIVPDMTAVDKILYYTAASISAEKHGAGYPEECAAMVDALVAALGIDDDICAIAASLGIDLEDELRLFLPHVHAYVTADLLIETAPWATVEQERHDTAKELYSVVRNRLVSYMVSAME